jgi:hypothetical protein
MKLRHLPPRLATGAFVLNSGLNKRNADPGTAAGIHGMAAGTYPFLGKLEPEQFIKLLSAGEMTLGTALLLPVVPTGLAALGLAAFSGGLVGLYLKTPGLRKEGSIFPTQDGTGIAKDAWMLGIALGFIIEAVADARSAD